jgi:hypothetical protein
VVPAAGIGLALRNIYRLKIVLNKRTLYRKSQKIPISSTKLISPIKLGLALSRAPQLYQGACSIASCSGRSSAHAASRGCPAEGSGPGPALRTTPRATK